MIRKTHIQVDNVADTEGIRPINRISLTSTTLLEEIHAPVLASAGNNPSDANSNTRPNSQRVTQPDQRSSVVGSDGDLSRPSPSAQDEIRLSLFFFFRSATYIRITSYINISIPLPTTCDYIPPTIHNVLHAMATIKIIPLSIDDSVRIPFGEGDTTEYLSTDCLRSWFAFHRTYIAQDIHPKDVYPTGHYLLISIPNIAAFIDNFHQYLTKNELKSIAVLHNIRISSKTRHLAACHQINSHLCKTSCKTTTIVLKLLQKNRRNPVKLNLQDLQSMQPTPHHQETVPTQVTSTRVNVHANEAPNNTPQSQLQNEFPRILSGSERAAIIQEWQSEMNIAQHIQYPCAVCAQCSVKKDIKTIDANTIDLTLLQNNTLPERTLPTTYNFQAYDRAILYPKALHDINRKGKMNMCNTCHSALVSRSTQPLNSLANFQYFAHDELPAHVKAAFEEASIFELQMVARCRATRITHLFSAKKNDPAQNGIPSDQSQGYSKGNVAILPQDTLNLRQVLPPSQEEVSEALCVLFIGPETKPSRENIKKLRPILVSKQRILTLIDFLTKNNFWYTSNGVEFSQQNMDSLFPADDGNNDCSVLAGLEVCHLTGAESQAVNAAAADYTDRAQLSTQDNETDLAMEAVGYTSGDHTPENYRIMKAKAIAWCLDRKRFLKVKNGTPPLQDSDPALLASLFPHLDPWGISGLYVPERTRQQKLSIERTVRNLLLQHNSPFQKDPNFAYVCWNIIQKRNVNNNVAFRTKADTQQLLATQLTELAPSLTDLVKKWELNPHARPTTLHEKKATKLLNNLRMVAKDLKGTTGYKLSRRNEIRALMKTMSTPALFITINPSDLTNPLVAVMAGTDADLWTSMNKEDRARFVANNPGAAARFFDTIMRAFIDIILGFGKKEGGLFGKCTAYYGMVEAQGRGTLHCHLLVWLEGNPSPQKLRDLMAEIPGYKEGVFNWIESIIKCELPGMETVVEEVTGIPLSKPVRPRHVPDPRIKTAPTLQTGNIEDEPFATQFKEFVRDIAIECNWHEHTHTCWKHLRPEQSRDDAHCRMRINGSTRAITELDPETESILLRRLHPRINNFNDVVIFLLRCNMDIKYIGSGEAAKALVYYVTDYVTKSTLPTHVGLGALAYAVKQNNQKFIDNPLSSNEIMKRSLFTKMVNAMMARHETSHQQVMSYLIGGGDHYKSHTFALLRWCDFDRYLRNEISGEPTNISDEAREEESELPPNAAQRHNDPADSNADTNADIHDLGGDRHNDEDYEDDEPLSYPDTVTILMKEEETLTGSNDILDYRYRSTDSNYDGMCLWEYTEYAEKITQSEEQQRLSSAANHDRQRQQHDLTLGRQPSQRPGRKASIRGQFKDGHPQVLTHLTRKRDTPHTPVLLGDALPRGDRSAEEREHWCRAMLILFKPWREPDNIKGQCATWSAAFDEWLPNMTNRMTNIISNMNVENQCNDARETYEILRRQGRLPKSLMAGFTSLHNYQDMESLSAALMNDESLSNGNENEHESDTDDDSTYDTCGTQDFGSQVELQNDACIALARAGLFRTDTFHTNEVLATPREVQEDDRPIITVQTELMSKLKRNKRPSASRETQPDDPQIGQVPERIHRHRHNHDPHTTIDQLQSYGLSQSPPTDREPGPSPTQLLDDIIRDNIGDNEEQQRALRIVGDHCINESTDQLLLYVAGVGGSGKSHVINTIVQFLDKCGKADQVLLSAPTGCAAVLIKGYTIHALTFLPKTKWKPDANTLERIWRNINYLIIDEISMVSAKLLADISSRICQAKAWDTSAARKPFGGVNMIFTGDFGQLRPVQASSLFSHKLVKNLSQDITEKPHGQLAIQGASLWRQVDKVVQLKKNMRAISDPRFVNLLGRVRTGTAWDGKGPHTNEQMGNGVNYQNADFDILQSRLLSTIQKDPESMNCFHDAPIIVSLKTIRDAINIRKVKAFAASTSQDYHCYYSKDRYCRQDVPETQKRKLWSIRSSITKDSLGILPLVPGAKVMITENIAIKANVVNGAEGVLKDIIYELDEQGRRYAVCAYVHIAGSNLQAPNLPFEVIPILPVSTTFRYSQPGGLHFNISRTQLPLVPAYAYTDYKSQGRSIHKVVIDLTYCFSLQSAYVMLSRAKSLNGLAILRFFPPKKITQRISEEFRAEFRRLDELNNITEREFGTRMDIDTHF